MLAVIKKKEVDDHNKIVLRKRTKNKLNVFTILIRYLCCPMYQQYYNELGYFSEMKDGVRILKKVSKR